MSYVPDYYEQNPNIVDKRCGKLLAPNIDRAAAAGRSYGKQTGLRPSTMSTGQPNIVLAVIDNQLDFVSPDIGALCVPGAVEDVDRLNRFIYRNVAQISHIVASLDTHYLYQPFHRMNWQAGDKPTVHTSGPQKGSAYQTGEQPDPFTLITLADVDNGVWRPTRNLKHSKDMLTALERDHKKTLCIWPFHCILGTPGHAFDPTFMEAMFFHSAARQDQYNATTKGMSQFSEHYGILRAEVLFNDDPNTQLNVRILNEWNDADRVYFAGQAKSHCVLETLNQVVEFFTKNNKNDLLQKLYVLEDCMSSVPDIKDEHGKVIVPFDNIANTRFAELRKIGVRFVKSTETIAI